MNKTLSACLLSLAAWAPLSAMAAEPLVRFDGGIGEMPLSSPNTPNTVFGVLPGGQPWVISGLSADVSTDGQISVDGRGLLLAGGNGIGTNGGQSVRARLICGGLAFDSDTVPLDERGDFRINSALMPFPPVPCTSPALLILSAANGRWFAAGIPKR
jgi:hypothetical protein